MVPGNQITLLQNGEEFFPAVEAALDRAVHDIYLETYILKNDAVGRRIAEALGRAARRGVKTHVLVDGYGSLDLPQSMVNDLWAAGAMLLKFRPKTSPWTLRRRRLRRLHRKVVVVDRKIAFVGGINMVDDMESLGQTSPRYDYAVSVEGPVVEDIYNSVRHVWSRVTRTRLLDRWKRRGEDSDPLIEPRGPMRSAFLARDNILHRRDIEDAYMRAIEQAKSDILIANAFFFPGLNFRHALLDAAGRGVKVVLLLQGKVENRLLYCASHALYGDFLDGNIEIHEYHKSLMHAKVAVIDEHWATVGSSNLDPFSLLLSLEANIVVEDEAFAKQLKRSLMRAIEADSLQIVEKTWRTKTLRLRLSWLCYGLVRVMIGIAGYAPSKNRINYKPRRNHSS